MQKFLQKYVNFYSLAIINLVVVLIVFTVRNVFFGAGYIHLLSAVFAFIGIIMYLSAERSVRADKHLKAFFRHVFLVLILLGAAHLTAHLAMQKVLMIEMSAVGPLVLVYYVFSILVVIAGVEYLLQVVQHKRKRQRSFIEYFVFAIILCFGLGYFFLSDPGMNLADPAIFFIGLSVFYVFFRLYRLRQLLVPAYADFVEYLAYAVAFILISGLFEYFSVTKVVLFPAIGIVFMTHFGVNVAISFFMLALAKSMQLGTLKALK